MNDDIVMEKQDAQHSIMQCVAWDALKLMLTNSLQQ